MKGTGAHASADRSLSVPKPGRWSLAAWCLAVLGVAISTWFILETDSDPGGILWPLVLAPAVIALLPIVLPLTAVRLVAAVAMGAWCVLATFSIGMFLLPALAAQIGAVLEEGR